MKIRYLNGLRLYNAFVAGGRAVMKDQEHLNRINVFPVPDADTGTNLASTVRSIMDSVIPGRSLKDTLHAMADTALTGARGNSGIIFAQFIHGISSEIQTERQLSTLRFGEAVRSAVRYAYSAMAVPREGTMLTVMRDWAEAVYRQRARMNDFTELLAYSLRVARKSLRETPRKLAVLAKAGVVDAGAQGFVDFLEGISAFIRRGRLGATPEEVVPILETDDPAGPVLEGVEERYCTEALLAGSNLNLGEIRNLLQSFGRSAIVAGGPTKARIHVHTDQPGRLFTRLRSHGDILQIKADDMLRQYQAGRDRIADIGLVTDSACDLPQEILDRFRIHVIPFSISFGESRYLDKITLPPDIFYDMLDNEPDFPRSSQPGPKAVRDAYGFLSSHYRRLIAVHISGSLSGLHQLASRTAGELEGRDIQVFDSRQLTAAQGLIVLRIAEAIERGWSWEKIVGRIGKWIDSARVLVDVQTLKYMVRGGRVSPLKGALANALNLKPIISLDENGAATGYGKSFSRRGSLKKILAGVERMTRERGIWNYAIVHARHPERAEVYAQNLTRILQRPPAYVMPLSPVVGVHNGIGAVAVCLMLD